MRRRYGRAYANSRCSGGCLSVSIAVRMRAVPAPGGADDGLDVGERRRPVQFGFRFLRRRVQHRGIAGPPGPERPGHRAADDLRYRVDHLLDRMRTTGTEVVGARLASLDDRLER